MEAFAKSHTKSIRHRPSTGGPDASSCLKITEVAPTSVAGLAGVRSGDLVVAVDGQPGGSVDPNLHRDNKSTRRYEIYLCERQETLDLETTGVDLGVRLLPTVEAIVEYYDPGEGDCESLELLWDAGEWSVLERLARDTLDRRKGLLATVLGARRNSPALVMLGAALFEQGRRHKGLQLINEYFDKYVSDWTVNYAAIALYYLGLSAQERGLSEKAVEAWERAYADHPCDRIADQLEKQTGTRPTTVSSWLDRMFPIDYCLDRLEESGEAVSFSSSLATMKPHQLLGVCLLANYRGNGPYNDFMRHYLSFADCFRTFWHTLHVITMEEQRRWSRSHYYAAEDEVRAAGLPLHVLWDRAGLVTETIEPQGSPMIMLINHNSEVVHEGCLDGVDLWNVFARTLDQAGGNTLEIAPTYEADSRSALECTCEDQPPGSDRDASDDDIAARFRTLFSVSNRVHLAPDIPADYLDAAREKFLFLRDDEELLGLFDETLSKTCEDGFALTTRRLYWRLLWDSPEMIRYEDIAGPIRLRGMLSGTIDLGEGRSFDVNMMESDVKERLIQFLTEVSQATVTI